MRKIGFMQGRLSPKPEDRIQAFPKDSWREEFERAERIGFNAVELIFDELYLEVNPLISKSGRHELVTLSERHNVALHSICSDYFMPRLLVDNIDKAIELFEFAADIGCSLVEFPFVGNASLYKSTDRNRIADALKKLLSHAEKHSLRIALETDLPPLDFRDFLNQFPANLVGANLDVGNSAMWGWDAFAECHAFGSRIFNVHIKDGVFGGSTVPVGTGHTDFERSFKALKMVNYSGDFILQTCPDPDYLAIAAKYRNMTQEWTKIL